MRVELVTSLTHGGPVEHAVVLARALGELGVDVGAVCATPGLARRFREGGAEATVIPLRHSADVGGARRVRKRVRGADVVHAQDRRSGLWVRLGPRPRPGGVRVYTVHGLPDEYLPAPAGDGPGLRAWLAYRGIDATLCRRADAVVVPSRAIADRLVGELRFPRSPIVVIPNGVDVDGGSARGGELVGTVTTLEPVKGLDVLLAAAARLAERRPGLRYAIYGRGSERERLAALAGELGLDGRVELPGMVDKRLALSSLRVFVLSSYMENCPMALLEAMAAGVPVVATAVGGVPEVAEGVAELVPAGDPEALADAVDAVLDAPDAARRRAEAARTRVVERFSAAANARATLDLYERLLARRRA